MSGKKNEKALLNPYMLPYFLFHPNGLVRVVRIPCGQDFNANADRVITKPAHDRIPPQNPPKTRVATLEPKHPKEYLAMIAQQMGVNVDVAAEMLRKINLVSPGALLNTLLMTIAKDFDMSHEGHISEVKEIFYFSTMDSKIYSTNKHGIKKSAFKYFAAFRSSAEAVLGIRTACAVRNLLYANGGK